MEQDLIDRRERAMDRADIALDNAWPERKGEDYVNEMELIAKELEDVVMAMHERDSDLVELSRTYSNLGSVYSDLAPALGHKMLIKAREAYLKAETFLNDCNDQLMHAKLNFNFANTLRQIDPDNILLLEEAKDKFLFAKKIFAIEAPHFLKQVDTGLQSVENLLTLAPLIGAVNQNILEMEKLEKEIEDGEDTLEIIKKAHTIINRGGGNAYGLISKIQNLMNVLPPELKQSEKFAQIQAKMSRLTKHALGGGTMENQNAKILKLLQNRLDNELNEGNVSADRAESITGLIGQLQNTLSGDDEDLQNIMEKAQKLRNAAVARFDMLHYLSHGIPRPPGGSRAAELIENCWLLRRFLAEEMSHPNKGIVESKEILNLNMQAANVDKRIYEAGADDNRAMAFEKDEFRPFALAVRNFSSRTYSMLSQPIWSVSYRPVDTNAVFFSGSSAIQGQINKICSKLGLSLIPAPQGESFSNARWEQIQKGMITIFDLGVKKGPELASVTYELGIALALGKPIIVITTRDKPLPFDVDIEPVLLNGDQNDEQKLTKAIDRSIVRTYDQNRSKDYLNTVNFIQSKYPRPHSDTYVDQTLRLLEDQKKDTDPLVINRTIKKLVEFLNDGKTMMIHPAWKPLYPKSEQFRLFHVMPFSTDWANDVMDTTRKASEAAGVEYIRGDEADDPNVICSIWEEIAQATHVVVDLTDFNTNVALELGITHTLGRPCLLMGQGNTVKQLFPMIAKQRFKSYNDMKELDKMIRDFFS